jgi:hypothetical protein
MEFLYRQARTRAHYRRAGNGGRSVPQEIRCQNSLTDSEPRNEGRASPSRGRDWRDRSWPCGLLPF